MKQSKNVCLWVAFFIATGCSLPERGKSVTIGWENNKATSLIIPNSLVSGISPETLSTDILVSLGDSTSQPILGEFTQKENAVVFRPLVPFTRGLHYHVAYQMQLIGDFDIPIDENVKAPQLKIFPSTDTVPENLLKVYFEFTEPMVEGQSLNHVHLVDKKGDTLANTFLDLQPELWNPEGTILTLWLDPGRVKRDLIPNKMLGNPIVKDRQYTLYVSPDWKGKSGVAMEKSIIKKFWVTGRDEKMPAIEDWTLSTPLSDTKEDLVIRFPEPLDFSLIQSAIHLINSNETVVGTFIPLDDERGVKFTRTDSWSAGNYTLQIDHWLEDLAGNNLTRPFDKDLKKEPVALEQRKFEIKFTIQ
jgi:hypothetical protein